MFQINLVGVRCHGGSGGGRRVINLRGIAESFIVELADTEMECKDSGMSEDRVLE